VTASRTGPDPRRSSRPIWLLAAGAVLGLAWAALGLLERGGGGALPADAVASVNGEPVPADDYARMLAALASDRRDPLDDEDRRHVLDRMVDEELLVQRALELGLARHDRRVRADLTSALIASVVSEAEERQPSASEIEAFYAETRDFFARPGRLRARQVLVRADADSDAARARADQAAARLRAGEELARVASELGDPEDAPLPDALLPPMKLREYLGPTALRTLLGLAPGAVSEPVRSEAGWRVLVLVEREAEWAPPLAEIEEQVRAEWVRRQGEIALREYLDELRRRADVRLAEDPR
jgi:parvulin-like peptidyl-prolyl isomerase